MGYIRFDERGATVLGYHVQAMRHGRGLTRGKLATAVGLSTNEVRQIESGKQRNVPFETLSALNDWSQSQLMGWLIFESVMPADHRTHGNYRDEPDRGLVVW